jgi:hypothetical protein
MKNRFLIYIFLFLLGLPQLSFAMSTELGLSYSRKKTSFDESNFFDSESTTGSASFYFMETVALELSYTEATGIRQEKASSTDSKRTIIQSTQVIGSDLIYVLAGRQALLQPYIKGGGARISRKQEVQIEGFGTQTLEPEVALVPSYGAGLKIAVTSQLGIKFSYDAWQTPIGSGQTTSDNSIRAGVTWLF